MGFGHRVYRAEDPRARVLRRTASELGAPRYEVAEALEQAALAELRERRPDRVLETNVEFWAAVVLDFAEVPAAHVHRRCSPAPGPPAGARTSWSRSAPAGSSARPPATSGPARAARRTCPAGTDSMPCPYDGDLGRCASRPGPCAVLTPDSAPTVPTRERTATTKDRPGDHRTDPTTHHDPRRPAARRRPLRLRAVQGPPRAGRTPGRDRRHGAGHLAPAGAGQGPGRAGSGRAWPTLFALPDGLRGGARQRRRRPRSGTSPPSA